MRQPDLIIFNPDQWRGDVMGHLDNPAAVTPFIDRMVRQDAISFRHAFCQNPVCTPSRCSFMSGWYPHVRGHRTMYHMLHPEWDEPNLLQILKDNGYQVWWGGKNDLTPGQDDVSRYCNIKHRPDRIALEQRGLTLRPGLHSTASQWRGPSSDDNYYSFFCGKLDAENEEIYCDEDWAQVLGAIDFIRNYDSEQPFCIFLPLQYPHPPYGVEEPYFSAIDRRKLPPRLPAGPGDNGKPVILDAIRQRQNLTSWNEERWTELRAVYYGMCARLDRQLEMLTESLKEKQRYDDCALFLFSDHGDFTGDYGLVEKTQNTFEDCLVRVPLIFKPPRSLNTVPGVREAMVELIDFTETVYALTGIEPGYDRFGKSLLPLLRNDRDDFRDAVFCEGGRLKGEVQAMERDSTSADDPAGLYWPRCSLQISDEQPWHGKAVMCRTQTHKYVYRLYEKDELYDLQADPGEEYNLIDDPRYREIATVLKERTLRWMVETADVVPRKTDRR
ncbi:MAG: Choline-sulfatase [Syntrophaceae bacterium PtaU1.Bin231]|nr:MAG: Choline-sulfatase [Syntrophaceae bacterium PtaU1.Bin231]